MDALMAHFHLEYEGQAGERICPHLGVVRRFSEGFVVPGGGGRGKKGNTQKGLCSLGCQQCFVQLCQCWRDFKSSF